jgi:hypothetical protein
MVNTVNSMFDICMMENIDPRADPELTSRLLDVIDKSMLASYDTITECLKGKELNIRFILEVIIGHLIVEEPRMLVFAEKMNDPLFCEFLADIANALIIAGIAIANEGELH